MRGERQGVFISWVKYHGRSHDLANALGLDAWYIVGGRGPAPIRYVSQSLQTLVRLAFQRPPVVTVMLPPLPLILTVRVFGLLSRVTVIADLHSGVFLNPKWRWAQALTLRLVGKRSLAIVTNLALKAECSEYGIRAVVLHDLLAPVSEANENTCDDNSDDFVLVPLSYANDEPIDEILAAAALDPEINWVLTGAAPNSVRTRATPNVAFAGYVSDKDFQELMKSTALVVALTNRPHTMQRAGYEAMMYEKPLVTSDFPELRDFFQDAAQYPDLNSHAIARDVANVLSRQRTATAKMHEQRLKNLCEQEIALTEVSCWLDEQGR